MEAGATYPMKSLDMMSGCVWVTWVESQYAHAFKVESALHRVGCEEVRGNKKSTSWQIANPKNGRAEQTDRVQDVG